ncbi:MAG: hypothetical protein U9N51_08365 [Bacteroidota bacterium]|nr:hypothetical protein [Bacteroidota bacterium]
MKRIIILIFIFLSFVVKSQTFKVLSSFDLYNEVSKLSEYFSFVKVKGSLGDYLIWSDMGADTLFYLNYDNDNLKLIPVLINNHSYFDNEYLDYPDDAFQTEQTLFILAQNRVLEFEKLDNDIVYYRDIYIEESLKKSIFKLLFQYLKCKQMLFYFV